MWSLAWIGSRHFDHLPASYDSCYYLVVAKGFATGHAYQDLAYATPAKGALLGPSLFPLLLSLYWSLHAPLFWLKLTMAALTACAPVAAFFWLRLFLPFLPALLSALAFGASYMFIVLGNSVMTETVFAPLLYAAMILSHRNVQDTGGGSSRRGGFAAALLWAALARTRVVGWCFWAVFLFLSGKRKRWDLAALAAGTAGLWVALERLAARGAPVVHYADGLFTKTYPVIGDPARGAQALLANAWHNLFGFATAIDAHILFPFLYDLGPMGKLKRLACLAVFLWTAWGAVILWKRETALRPWLVAVFVASLPTFLIFEPHDSFRYHMPYFPFFALFLLMPFVRGDAEPKAARRSPVVWGAAALALFQVLHAATHNFDIEFIDYAQDFENVHAAAAERPAVGSQPGVPGGPEVCLSPVPYYTWLRTGCPSLMLHKRHGVAFVKAAVGAKRAWAWCGPRNDEWCAEWEREGVKFGPPVSESGPWRVMPVLRWPDSAADAR